MSPRLVADPIHGFRLVEDPSLDKINYPSKPSKAPWVLNIHDHRSKTEPDTKGQWEISLVRDDNQHGKASYGWPDPDKKVIIASSGHFGGCPEFLWWLHLQTARMYRDNLMDKDSR